MFQTSCTVIFPKKQNVFICIYLFYFFGGGGNYEEYIGRINLYNYKKGKIYKLYFSLIIYFINNDNNNSENNTDFSVFVISNQYLFFYLKCIKKH